MSKKALNILLSNDDGVHSPGIQILAETLEKQGHRITIVAPAQDRSTVGHSLTLHKPLRHHELKPNQHSISGSPADCVYMATRYLLKEKPDLIISGINKGANLGQDTFYSGTCAAAREGALFGIPAIAVSLVVDFKNPQNVPNWKAAATLAAQIAPKVLEQKIPPKSIVININVPDLPLEKIKGIKLSRQGRRVYDDLVTQSFDPRRKPYYWVGGFYSHFDDLPESDCQHVDQGYVSIVPLKIDTTDYELLPQLAEWSKISL